MSQLRKQAVWHKFDENQSRNKKCIAFYLLYNREHGRTHFEYLIQYLIFKTQIDSMTTLAQCWYWVVSLADGYPLAVQCWPNVGPTTISI